VEGIAGGEVARQRSRAREGNTIGTSSCDGGGDERGAMREERAARMDRVGCRSVGGWARRVPQGGLGSGRVRKTLHFCQKRSANCNFYGRSTLWVQQLDDGWVPREGYGGPDFGEKSFQLSSLLIV
jgi:hypothetical protein